MKETTGVEGASDDSAGPSNRRRALPALGWAVLAAVVMGFALGVGTGLGGFLADVLGLEGLPARVVPALLVTLLGVPVLVWSWRRRHGDLRGMGLTGHADGLRGFALGVAVTFGSATLVFGAGTAAGWLRWGTPDPAALLGFLLTNALVAVLLEALPEELSLRGYAWGSLRGRFSAVVAAIGATGLFLLVPAASSVFAAALSLVLPGPTTSVWLAPGGQDPVTYLVLLTFFGATLLAARLATRTQTIWTSVGVHLSFLTVNRIVVANQGRDTGWPVELEPAAQPLVLVYLVLAAAAFLGVRRAVGRRGRPSRP